MRGEVEVRTSDGGSYPVVIGPGAITELPGLLRERAPAHRYALIADEGVLSFHGKQVGGLLREAGIPFATHTFPAGEIHKTRAEWMRLTDSLLADGLGRDGCVLALGGGVTGDLAGFVAATYLRGIPVVQLPTSLVAMVDASVGGKTGVDVPAGKNLVGAFHPPAFVLGDTDFIATLPVEERRQGLAEVVKHGVILDQAYLAEVESGAARLLAAEPETVARVVRRSVEIKAEVVSRDEREGGLREILNFGHTLGHGLERLTEYRLPHGAAVAIGMVLEAALGESLGVTREGTAARIAGVLGAFGLPTDLGGRGDLAALPPLLLTDKKVRGGEVRIVFPAGIGGVAPAATGWSHRVPLGRIGAFLRDQAGGGV